MSGPYLPGYDAWKTREPEYDDPLCENCGKRPPVDGEEFCQECIDNAAEAAYERQTEAFYGGGEPVTMDEIHRAAWEEKQRLR